MTMRARKRRRTKYGGGEGLLRGRDEVEEDTMMTLRIHITSLIYLYI